MDTAKLRTKQVPRGQIVFYQDDSPAEVYIIKSGIIKMYDISDQGDEKILHLLKEGAVMPLAFFSGDAITTRWFYAALTDCELYITTHNELKAAFLKDPGYAMVLTNWFSQEVHELLVRLGSLGKTSARSKVIAALKFLAVCLSEPTRGAWRCVTFPVTHQLIADLTGITRESAALSMKQIQDEGLIKYPKLTLLHINYEKISAEE